MSSVSGLLYIAILVCSIWATPLTLELYEGRYHVTTIGPLANDFMKLLQLRSVDP